MSDKLEIEVESSGAEETLLGIATSVKALKAALDELSRNSPAGKIRSDLESVNRALTGFGTQVMSALTQVRLDATVAGQAVGDAYAKGLRTGLGGAKDALKEAELSQAGYLKSVQRLVGERAAAAAALASREQQIQAASLANQLSAQVSHEAMRQKLLAERAAVSAAAELRERAMQASSLANQLSTQASHEAMRQKLLAERAAAADAAAARERQIQAASLANQLSTQAAHEAMRQKLLAERAAAAEAAASRERAMQASSLANQLSTQASHEAMRQKLLAERVAAAEAVATRERQIQAASLANQLSAQASHEAMRQKLLAERAAVAEQFNFTAQRSVRRATAGASGAYSLIDTGQVVRPAADAGNLSQVSDAARRATGSMNDLHSAARGVASGFNAMWLTWGNIGPLLAGAALSNAFVQSIRKGSEFTHTLTAIEALAGESAESVKVLSDRALELGDVGPFGPLEMSQAFKTLALAGKDASEQLAAVGAVRNFAIVGETDLKSSAEGLVAISTAYAYSAQNYNVVADIITKTAASSMASVQDMTEAFRQASVVGQQYGVTLQDSATSLALLSQIGITGSAAGTAMRNMYTELMGTSKKAREVLKETLKVDVWDNAAKAMKPLPVIMQELAESLSKMDSKSQQSALNALGNERGTKALVANLVALQTEWKTTGKVAKTEMDRIAHEIENSAGYAAQAAAVMGLSTSNQLKSVGAALETSLVRAFVQAEPAVQRLAMSLRQLFASDEFQSAVGNLAGSLARLMTLILDNADAIISVIKVMALYKGAVLAFELATAAKALVVLRATAALSTMQTAIKGAAVLLGAVVPMSSAMATGLGLVGPAAAGAAGGVSMLMAALGPVAAVLAVAGAAWLLFGDHASEGMKKAREAAEQGKTSRDAIMEGIEAEIARLNEKARVRDAGLKGAQAADKVEENLAIARIRRNHQERLSLIDLEEQEARTASKAWYKNLPGMGNDAESGLQNTLQELEGRRAAIRSQLGGDVMRIMLMNAKAREEAKQAAEDARKASQGRPTGTETFDPDAASGAASRLTRLQADDTVKNLEKTYSAALQAASDYASTRKTVLDNARSAEAISEGAYLGRELALVEASEAANLAVIEAYSARILAAYDDRRAQILAKMAEVDASKAAPDRKKEALERLTSERDGLDGSRTAFKESVATQRVKLDNDSLVRAQKQADVAAGAVRRMDEAMREFGRTEQRLAEARRSDAALESSLLGVSEGRAEVIRAEYDERKRLVEIDRQYIDQLDEAQRRLSDFRAATEGSDAFIITGEYSAGQQGALEAQLKILEKIRDVRAQLAAQQGAKVEAAGLDAAAAQLDRMAGADLASVFDKATVSINGMGVSLGDLLGKMTALADNEDVYAKARKAAEGDAQKLSKADLKIQQARVGSYADLAGSAKAYFKEGSKGYKTLEAAETAFRVAEMVMGAANFAARMGWIATETTAKVASEGVKAGAETAGTALSIGQSLARTAVKAKEALVSALSAPFPANIPAFAAVAAILAGLGIAAGGGSSGTFAPTNEGTGTVLGDASAKSDSIAKSLELLESLETLSGVQLQYTMQMANSLRNLESQLGGVSSLVTRNGSTGFAAGGVMEGMKLNGIGKAFDGIGNLLSDIPILGGFLGGALKAIGNLFGTKTTIKGSGLYAPGQSMSDILAGGLDLSSYVDVEKKKKFLGVTTSKKNSSQFADAGEETTNQFTLVLKSLADTVRSAATPLAQATDQVAGALGRYVVNLGKIDLRGLNGEQVQERLTAVFSAEGDKMARAVMPGLDALQLVGEGYLETLVRVSSTMQTVNDTLDTLGNTMYATSVAGATLAVALSDTFGGLEAYSSAMGSYYKNYYSEEERTANTAEKLTAALKSLGFDTMPKTRAEFRKLVDDYVAGGALLTQSGRETYASLITLSEPFHEITDAASEMADSLIESANNILDYVKELRRDRAGLATPTQQLQESRGVYVSDLALARSGDAEALERLTASADAYINAQKAVTASSDYTQAVIDQIIAELTGVANAAKSGVPGVPAYATGGYHAGGWALVGEEGPEYAYFDSPARIYNARESAAMGDNSELVHEVRALRAQVASLQAQQSAETRDLINSNVSAQQRAAGVVVDGMKDAAERQLWTQQNQPTIK